MSVKKILLLGNEELYKISEELCREDLPEAREKAEDLHDTLMDFRNKYKAGRAIAAPQIGYFKRMIYMNVDKPIVFINPRLEYLGDEMIEVWE